MKKQVLKTRKKASSKRSDVSAIKKELKDSLITIDIKENVISELRIKNNLLHSSHIELEKKLAELTANFNDISEKRTALEQIFESRCIELIATTERANTTESNLNAIKHELVVVSEKLEIAQNKANAYELEVNEHNKQAAIKKEELFSLQLKLAALESSIGSLTNELTHKNEKLSLANTLVESTKNELIIANSKNNELESAITNQLQSIRLLEEKINTLQNTLYLKNEELNKLQAALSKSETTAAVQKNEIKNLEHLLERSNKLYSEQLKKANSLEETLSIEKEKVFEERLRNSEDKSRHLIELYNKEIFLINDFIEKYKTSQDVFKEMLQLSFQKPNEARELELQNETRAQLESKNAIIQQHESTINALASETEQLKRNLQQTETNLHLKDAHINNLAVSESNLNTVITQRERDFQKLIEEKNNLNKSIDWYKATYHERKLAGIVKDRLVNTLKPSTPTDKESTNVTVEKEDGLTALQKSIINYINSNPLTVKKLDNCPPVSIIVLSFNRLEDTLRGIENIYKYTTCKFELIVLDNNSYPEVKVELKKLVKKHDNMRLILETKNLGASGGKLKASRYAKYDYLFYQDNDLMVLPYYMENLMTTLQSDKSIAGVCCKVVFPNGKIQFNGGHMVQDDGYALYSLHDYNLAFDDNSTNRLIYCEWLPGGATLWRRGIFEQFKLDEDMKGSFEDNENSLRMKNAGYKLVNSPAAIVIHNHYDFHEDTFKTKEMDYYKARYNEGRLKAALLHFYKKHNLIFGFAWKNNPWDMIWGLDSKEKIMNFINENNN